jgi:hypothetical protein
VADGEQSYVGDECREKDEHQSPQEKIFENLVLTRSCLLFILEQDKAEKH